MRQLQPITLKRPVCDNIESGHPWVFRDKIAAADSNLPDGAWLQLRDPDGFVVGTGLFQAQGGVAVRVMRRGPDLVTVDWLKKMVETAIAKRKPLWNETDAYRILNGESDGFPGIVVDLYAGVAVLQTYVPGVDALGRYLVGLVADRLQLETVVWKEPSKRVGGGGQGNRVLRGMRPYVVRFHEGPLKLAADLFAGQKSGTYLDLRGLRRFLCAQNLHGQKVLNLFAYTGMSGLACSQAGAKEVVNVDQAKASLDFGKRYHRTDSQTYVAADIFKWVDSIKDKEYDWIVVDPPSMANNKTQVDRALATYRRLYKTLAKKLKPKGVIVACCCTSRISTREFEQTVGRALGSKKLHSRIPVEIDHQPSFQEANYLKILVYE